MNKVMLKIWQPIRVVFWAFLGIRKKADQEYDFTRMKFLHIVLAALFAFFLIVGLLLLLVKLITF